MASEVHAFTCVIPAGTAKATPHTVGITLDNRELESVDLEVPPGPAGLMGFYVAHSGTPQFPLEAGQYYVWDDVKDSYKTEDYPTSQGWSVVGYNLDPVNNHSVIVRFHTNYPEPGVPAVPQVTIISTPIAAAPVTL